MWKKIRARALVRDKNTCRACKGKAQVVHHVRYPKNLGEEKMEWLYSLCIPCHDAIHRATTTMTLRKATDLILGASHNGNVIRLSDAGPPRGNRGRLKKKRSRKAKKRKKPAEIKPFEIKAGGPRLRTGTPVTPRKRKRTALQQANDELHAIQKRNRERREQRWQ